MPGFCNEKRDASGQRSFSNECGSYLIWTMQLFWILIIIKTSRKAKIMRFG